jgi:hypothetical protein
LQMTFATPILSCFRATSSQQHVLRLFKRRTVVGPAEINAVMI